MSSGARNVHEEIENFLSILGPGDQMARENSQTVGQKERYEKCEGTMEMDDGGQGNPNTENKLLIWLFLDFMYSITSYLLS